MLRLHVAVRAGVPLTRSAQKTCLAMLRLVVIVIFTWGVLFNAHSAGAAPAQNYPPLSLPTPEGQPWKIIQGYGCGTHNSWDRYSLDLASASGRTYGAPVRAAADGIIFIWVPKSGTLILDHGNGVYTMYTHMSSAISTGVGKPVTRGEVIGAVGDRGAPGTPHLHFTAFTADGVRASHRKSFPVSFVEGVRLEERGGCSQHQGEILTAAGQLANAAGLAFRSPGEPNRWYNQDLAIEFGGTAAARGFSANWETDPAGDKPSIANTRSGTAKLSDIGEGLHTLHVRAWDAQGNQTAAAYGPIGFDVTPPRATVLAHALQVIAGQPGTIEWEAAQDNGAGVAGYRIYLGSDASGTSEWYVAEPRAELQPLEAGAYVLRMQPIDYAGNAGEWTTIGSVVAQ